LWFEMTLSGQMESQKGALLAFSMKSEVLERSTEPLQPGKLKVSWLEESGIWDAEGRRPGVESARESPVGTIGELWPMTNGSLLDRAR